MISPNRGGPDAALRPSTQILKQQVSPFNLRNLYRVRRVRICALSGLIKRLRPLPKRKRLVLGPSVRNRYCLSPLEFFHGRHPQFRIWNRVKKNVWCFLTVQTNTRVALRCVEGMVCGVVLHLSYRRATPGCWCPFLQNPMGTIAIPPEYRRRLSWTKSATYRRFPL